MRSMGGGKGNGGVGGGISEESALIPGRRKEELGTGRR